MSHAPSRARREAPRRASIRMRDRPFPTDLAVRAAFVLALFLVAAWAAWPIYQGRAYLVMVAGTIVLASLIAWFGWKRSWSWFTVLLVTLAAYLLLGVPLAVPSAFAGVPAIAGGWLDLVAATVFGWKELLTIRIPVGDYQTLLAPAFLLFLGGLTGALSLVWRSRRLDVLAVPVLLLLIVFGIVFGAADSSPATRLAGLSLPAPRESAIGLAGFLLAFGFLGWRTHEARGAALRLAARSSGVRRRGGGSLRRVRRGLLAGGVLLLAVGVAMPAVATVARPSGREVLRAAIDPAVQLRDYVSPLSQYRSYFAAGRYDAEQFRVTASGGALTRIRLAVLSYYDGQVFRVVDPATGDENQETAFARLPPAPAGRNSTTATFTVGAYTGAWLPGAGSLTSIHFAGDRRQSLGDGYFYNQGTESGVQLNPLASGDSYTVQTVTAGGDATLADLGAPVAGARLVDDSVIPASLVDWVRAQKLGSDGPALAELVTRLRERGYLSHALEVPAADDAAWIADLGDYAFEPSLAGHSSGRIGALFTALLDKQNSTEATENEQLVAAVGDDEQFAVAAALVAQELGYPARVVLGFTLEGEEATAGASPGACVDGVCLGGDLTAWVEVQGADGAWVSVDASPQHVHPLAQTDVATRDPQISTEVLQQEATPQLPDNANPTSGDERAADSPETGPDLTWLFSILKTLALGLLVLAVLLTPFLAILAAKMLRRRERRRAPELSARFAGGWDEYVDAAVDRGLIDQGSNTRVEMAAEYATANGGTLAALADAAVFGPVAPRESDSVAFWLLVDEERALLLRDQPLRVRVGAALSLRSFTRLLGPRRDRTQLFRGNRLRLFRRDENRLEERPPSGGRATQW